MIRKIGLYIVATIITFALGSNEKSAAAIASLDHSEVTLDNPESYSIQKAEADSYLIAKNSNSAIDPGRIDSISTHNLRTPVRRNPNWGNSNTAIPLAGNITCTGNKPYYTTLTQAPCTSCFRDPSRYLIRLRKLII